MTMRPRVFSVMLMTASAVVLAMACGGIVRGQPSSPVYSHVIEVGRAAFNWKDAEKGGVSGSLKFSAKHPNQPTVVYLLADGGEGNFDAPAKLTIHQKGAKFDPGFAVLVRGQGVEFVNDESAEIDHNIYFLGAEELDLGIFQPKNSVEHNCDKAGEISLHCSIHKLMDGKLFVAPSPAFALVAGDQDSFEIKDVPVGKYTLKTYQKSKRFKDADLKLEVKKGETTKLDVEMTR